MTVKMLSSRPHNSTDPSSADHIVATLNGNGVFELPVSATYATDVSLVISDTCITNTAMTAPTNDSEAMGRDHNTRSARPRITPVATTTAPATHASSVRTSAALPSETAIGPGHDPDLVAVASASISASVIRSS